MWIFNKERFGLIYFVLFVKDTGKNNKQHWASSSSIYRPMNSFYSFHRTNIVLVFMQYTS